MREVNVNFTNGGGSANLIKGFEKPSILLLGGTIIVIHQLLFLKNSKKKFTKFQRYRCELISCLGN